MNSSSLKKLHLGNLNSITPGKRVMLLLVGGLAIVLFAGMFVYSGIEAGRQRERTEFGVRQKASVKTLGLRISAPAPRVTEEPRMGPPGQLKKQDDDEESRPDKRRGHGR